MQDDNDKEIRLHRRTVYGTKLYYPLNDTAELICDLLAQTTVLVRQFPALKALGYTLTIVDKTEE